MKPLAAAALAVLLAACAANSNRPAEIYGTVWSPQCGIEPGVCTFVRTAGAAVIACRRGAGCARTRSGHVGSYRLLLLRSGRYVVSVTVPGPFGAWRPSPRVVRVVDGARVRVDLGQKGS
jgi:hypothetical protein